MWIKADRIAESVHRTTRMNPGDSSECKPRRFLIDREVRITWSLSDLYSCIDRTHGKANRDQVPEQFDLSLIERIFGVEAASDICNDPNRIRGIVHVISRGDSDIVHHC